MANTSYIGVGPADRDPTVSDDSVTTAKIQDNAVTGTKIAMTSDAAGDVLYYNGTDYTRLAVGAAGKVLKVNSGATAPEWATDTAGTGDVVGPGSATDDALARFDTTTGKLIQNSTATLSDAGTLTATAFSGPLTGNVTGNVSGTAATVTTAAQPSITSVGTLTGFTSTGIDDNASANAITIESDGDVLIGTTVASTSRLHVYDAGFPAITGERFKTGETNAIRDVTNVILKTDANAADGFGPAMRFDMIDDTATGTLGSIGFIRDGSDNSGAMIVRTPSIEKFKVSNSEIKCQSQAYFPEQTLTFNATQAWDVSTNQVCRVVLTANITFSAPTNQLDGAFYSIMVEQDGTGGWTGSWNTVFKWAAATAPTLTTTASAKDIFVFRSDGTNMYEVGRQLNVS